MRAQRDGVTVRDVKNVELSDDAYAALQRLAAAKNLPPGDVLAALLGTGRPLTGDHLLFHLAGAEFAALADPTERYLSLLAWVAHHYAGDFADFVSHQESARRYLFLNAEQVNNVRAHNHARPIAGTPFWAVLAIDDATRARFVRRLLEFIGCHDETVTAALRATDLADAEPHGLRALTG